MPKRNETNGGAEPEPLANGGAIEVAIDRIVPEDLTTRFANHLVVVRGPHESFLTFFEIIPPSIMGTDEQKAVQIQALKSVKATAVARVVVPNEFVMELVKTLETNLNRGKERAGP